MTAHPQTIVVAMNARAELESGFIEQPSSREGMHVAGQDGTREAAKRLARGINHLEVGRRRMAREAVGEVDKKSRKMCQVVPSGSSDDATRIG